MLFLDENTNCSPEGFLQHQMPLFDAQFYSCLYGRASYLVVGLLLWQHCQRAASPWDVLSTENSKPQFTGRAAAVIALIVHLLMRGVWTWCEIQGESQGSRGNVLWIYTPPPSSVKSSFHLHRQRNTPKLHQSVQLECSLMYLYTFFKR